MRRKNIQVNHFVKNVDENRHNYQYDNVPKDVKTFQNLAHNRFLWLISFTLLIILVILVFPLLGNTYSWYKQLDSIVIRILCIICVVDVFLIAYHIISTLYNEDIFNKDVHLAVKIREIIKVTAEYVGLFCLLISLIIYLYSHQYAALNAVFLFIMLAIAAPIGIYWIGLNPNVYFPRGRISKESIYIVSVFIILPLYVLIMASFRDVFFENNMFPRPLFFMWLSGVLFFALDSWIENKAFSEGDNSNQDDCSSESVDNEKWSIIVPISVVILGVVVVMFCWANDPNTKRIRDADIIVSRFNTFEEMPINISTSGFGTSKIKFRLDRIIEDKINRMIAIQGFYNKGEPSHSIHVAKSNRVVRNYSGVDVFFEKNENRAKQNDERVKAVIWGFCTTSQNGEGELFPVCTYSKTVYNIFNKHYSRMAQSYAGEKTSNEANSVPILMNGHANWELDAWLQSILLMSLLNRINEKGNAVFFNMIEIGVIKEKMSAYFKELELNIAHLKSLIDNSKPSKDSFSINWTNEKIGLNPYVQRINARKLYTFLWRVNLGLRIQNKKAAYDSIESEYLLPDKDVYLMHAYEMYSYPPEQSDYKYWEKTVGYWKKFFEIYSEEDKQLLPKYGYLLSRIRQASISDKKIQEKVIMDCYEFWKSNLWDKLDTDALNYRPRYEYVKELHEFFNNIKISGLTNKKEIKQLKKFTLQKIVELERHELLCCYDLVLKKICEVITKKEK
ncbi:hypothetical protein KAR48_16180 [bacterium]|nr:hypothetical protein [bacterium]